MEVIINKFGNLFIDENIINKAKEKGKDTIVIGAEPGFSMALKNSADETILFNAEGTLISIDSSEDWEFINNVNHEESLN